MGFREYTRSPWIALGILVLGDIAMMGNIVPRDFAFLLAGLAVWFILGARRADAVTFLVAHIPFSPALPIPGFDSFALWRLVVIVFAGRILFENRKLLVTKLDPRRASRLLTTEDWVGLGFFVWATLSLLVAVDLVAGLRKLIFLGNAVLLYAHTSLGTPEGSRKHYGCSQWTPRRPPWPPPLRYRTVHRDPLGITL